MRRDSLILLVWLLAFALVSGLTWSRPASALASGHGGAELPSVAGRALPGLEELVGPYAAAGGGLPAWSAARGVPGEAAAPLTLAGLWHGLELAELRVGLGDGVSLVATGGRFAAADRMDIGPLHGEVDGGRALVARGARLSGGRIELQGPVVLRPLDAGRRQVLGDWSGTYRQLCDLLRR